MRIITIFIVLLNLYGFSIISTDKNTAAESCGFPILTDASQKHTIRGGNFFDVKTIIINSPKYGVKEVFVDDEDYELVSKYTWIINRQKNNDYAMSNGRDISKHPIYMHRLIMGFPTKNIDHRNRNTLDNTRNNLRLATKSQNAANAPAMKTNATGYRGVIKVHGVYYKASIKIDGEYKVGGYFKTPEEAAFIYNKMALLYFGEFAYLNELTDDHLLKIGDLQIRSDFRSNNNTSGYTGVYVDTRAKNKKYKAYIDVNKKRIFLGGFTDIKEAAKKYNEYAIKYYGDKAKLNIIPC